MQSSASEGGESRWGSRLVVSAYVALAAPVLWLDYLPMTDYPQHLALVSIMRNLHDPAYGFERWFEIDLGRTLYLLPYGMAWLGSYLVDLDLAMHAVAFLSVLAYPLGLWALLRALRRPPELALLAAPWVFNRAFYWGFINFNMAIGLALVALAAFLRLGDHKRPRDVAIFVASISATVLTHVYGLCLFVGVVGLWALLGGFEQVKRRAWLLIAPLIGALAWAAVGSQAATNGIPSDPPWQARLLELGDAICGGFLDGSDNLLLCLGLVVVLVSIARSRRGVRLTPLELALVLTSVGNLVLYFVLPESAASAWFIHFRHAFLALALLPALIAGPAMARWLRVTSALLALLVAINAYDHLIRFNAEAKGFDEVIERAPRAARGLAMNLTPWSAVVKAEAYLHFIAYVQANKGGFVAMSFPFTFWNLPVKVRSDVRIPGLPPGFEWDPKPWDDRTFGWFYDWALVRAEKQKITRSPSFPFERTFKAAPWQIYRRVAPDQTAMP